MSSAVRRAVVEKVDVYAVRVVGCADGSDGAEGGGDGGPT